ncbi:MAG: dTDP-glucose 4,6-dehydratase [Candidatus Woesearchaeota archaeon]|nr:dTDP-glucose 4,6-dehydratase [Candidatus Woesearchaeota archaeon]
MKLLVTGGAGFIGSNFVRHILNKYGDYKIINLDTLTYAGNLDNLKNIENNPNYKFVQGDICDKELVETLVKNCDAIINFAAETHVDRSIGDPDAFIKTDIFGTHILLEAARKFNIKKFIQISTDEVYGSIDNGSFRETDILKPSSPYSASKAGAEMLVHSYFVTFNLPVIITRSSNNFGPYQYPEKLIPLFVTNLIENKKVPVYGTGLNIRDWIYVIDNCEAIDFVLHNGQIGEIYNIGGGNEKTNLEITKMILKEVGKDESFIEYVKDRAGHDKRYALECSKIHKLGWNPRFSFENAMKETVKWYKENTAWWKKIKSGEFRKYYEQHYKERHGMK